MVHRILVLVALLLGMGSLAESSATAAASRRIINDSDVVILAGNVHPLARPESDAGPTAPSLPMERMILSLRLPVDREASLDRMLAEQQNPASPNFQRWLTPEQFAAGFAPSPADLEAVTGWLTSHGFSIDEIAKGRTWINFSGSVASVQQAFKVSMRNYRVNGRLHHANSGDPSLPRALSDLVGGIVSLHDFPRKTMHSGLAIVPDYTVGSSHYLSPVDFSTIYNVAPLYGASLDGSGQSIAIVGRTHPSQSNWSTFRSAMGLAPNPPVVIVNGADPGDLGSSEDTEADLDVEWAGAVARNATIDFVVSQSTASTDGVDLSAQYIVSNNLAPVMSTSFGSCESDLGHSERVFYNNLWKQAAAQGITSFVSSGDSGAAGCAAGSDSAGSGSAVNGLASTPYNVAVGGTQFNEGSGSFWSAGNGTGYGSAQGYIPEVAWNESGSSGGSGLWSTGGGASSYYGKPSWQSCPGVPSDGKRDLPDVSLSSGMHDGYLVQTGGGLYAVGGTSAASPSFAGIMALVVQKTGQRQGNANARLYQLGASQYGAGGAVAFHDITSGNNSVPGVTGYSCTAGYDLATGLGSVDAYALVSNWTPDFALSAASSDLTVLQRSSGALAITVTVVGNFNGSLSLSVSPVPPGVTALFAPPSLGAPGAGVATLSISADASTPAGTFPLTVTASDGTLTHAATVSLTVVQVYDLTAVVASGVGGTVTPSSLTVASGGSAVFSINPAAGYHLAGLTDNGSEVSSQVTGGAYTLGSVTAGHSIIASFAPDSFSVTATVTGGSGSVTPASSTVNFGAGITLVISAAQGYQLAALTDNDAAVAPLQNPDGSYSYSISDVTGPHLVQASFTVAVAAAAVPALSPSGLCAAFFLTVLFGIWKKAPETGTDKC